MLVSYDLRAVRGSSLHSLATKYPHKSIYHFFLSLCKRKIISTAEKVMHIKGRLLNQAVNHFFFYLEVISQWRSQNAEKVTHIKGRLLNQTVNFFFVPFQKWKLLLKKRICSLRVPILFFKSSSLWYENHFYHIRWPPLNVSILLHTCVNTSWELRQWNHCFVIFPSVPLNMVLNISCTSTTAESRGEDLVPVKCI